jgi:enoyl-CoA hydratase/carnithine racemase
MTALLKKSIPMHMVVDMQLTGIRLTAEECEKHHIVKKACPLEELLPEAIGFARTLNKRRPIIQELKNVLYKDIVHAITVEDVPIIESGRLSV